MLTFPIYFDNNSTTPIDSRVLEAMLPYFTTIYGNPSSKGNIFGLTAERVVEKYRKNLAECFNSRPDGIIFTSGATESINLVIKGLSEHEYPAKNHIISTKIDHSAVLSVLDYLQEKGFDITLLDVDSKGFIDPDELYQAIGPKTLLATIIAANNEIGTIQPWQKCAEICNERGIPLHLDFAQAGGKIFLDQSVYPVEFITISAHKNHGPKGVGALISTPKSLKKIVPQIHGGGQENGFRAGTINVPLIVGLCECMQLGNRNMSANNAAIKEIWDLLFNFINDNPHFMELNGPKENRLYSNINFHIKGTSLQEVSKCLKDVAFSSTSACNSGTADGSMVLKAIGKSEFQAKNSIRFGIGKQNTLEEMEYVISKLKYFTGDK